jgi:NADPH2:quinone reductase
MRAVVVQEFGDPSQLSASDIDEPAAPRRGEVLVRVAGVGAGYFDGLLIRGDYQIRPELPFVPGSSMSGVVEAVGDDVAHVSEGTPVAAFALHGGMAERVVLPAASCVPLPHGFDLHAAANFFVSWATSLYGLREIGRVASGETVLVLGAAGSTGTAAIQCAKALDAAVIACASTDEKRAHCIELGADHAVDYTVEGWRQRIKELTGGRGVDVIYDPVGGELADPALRLMAPGGRYLVVGFVAGIAKVPLNLPLLKRCSIHGVNWGGSVMADPSVVPPVLDTLVEWTAASRVDPAPAAVYRLERAGDAFSELFGRRSVGGIVVTLAPER